MQQLIYALFFIIGISLSCNSSRNETPADFSAIKNDHPGYTLEYQIDKNHKSFSATLLANPVSMEMILPIHYHNKTDHVIDLNSEEFVLTTPNGGRSYVGDTIPLINPGETALFFLNFRPVNDRLFYNKTGFVGDLNSSYQLESKSSTPLMTFKLPEKKYTTYIAEQGIEKDTEIFQHAIDTTLQKLHQRDLGIREFLHADDVEISIAGANLHFNAYRIHGQLHLDVKIVNHSEHQLVINPDVFMVRLENSILSPGEPPKPVNLRKGERFIHNFIYPLEHPVSEFSLLKEGIEASIDGQLKSLLKTNLLFTR